MTSKAQFFVPLATSSCCVPTERFWEAVLLYHDRSHLVNRKLAAVSQVLFHQIRFNANKIKNIYELFTRSSILYETKRLKELSKDVLNVSFLKNLVECYDKNVEFIPKTADDLKNAYDGIFISVRILLPRIKKANKCIEVVILNRSKDKAMFLAVEHNSEINCTVPFAYEIELTSSSILRINLMNFEYADTPQADWLADKLFTKLLKWTENDTSDKPTIKSLSLIEEDTYCLTYNKLKETYAEKLVAQWPEKSGTDPQKYVYEDLAIASYLICLWEKYSKDEIKFVDCGCGNGLLVYILNQEGFSGYGLDIRRRRIWDIFPEETRLNLKIGTVTPDSTFLDSTWLIGNHSDELTPWIPVLALRNSPKTNFFVLPCCPYDFSGQKYIRNNSSISAYSDYLSYVKDICIKCGFETDIDKLRIPSTKRTSLIGVRKEANKTNLKAIRTDMARFIESRMKSSDTNFVPRNNVEKVRNCTQLEKELILRIINICVCQILAQENLIPKSDGSVWNKGGKCTIPYFVEKIPKDDLSQLKKECGGLLTLLKNHRYIFEVQKDGVGMRIPVKLKEESKYKNKPCWFFKNHPNGCLHSTNICGYSHVN